METRNDGEAMNNYQERLRGLASTVGDLQGQNTGLHRRLVALQEEINELKRNAPDKDGWLMIEPGKYPHVDGSTIHRVGVYPDDLWWLEKLNSNHPKAAFEALHFAKTEHALR